MKANGLDDHQLFRARICQPRRDTNTGQPKRLFNDIYFEDGTEFRDHCWVNENIALNDYYPRYNKEVVIVEFMAKIKSFGVRNEGRTLSKLCNFQLVERYTKRKSK